MPRHATRDFLPAIALIALVFLFPALATALPQRPVVLAGAEHLKATPGLSQLWGLLSALWSENGSILDPNGAAADSDSGSGTEPDAASSGDNGSGLDPNG